MKTKLLLAILFITSLFTQAQTATPFITGQTFTVGIEKKDNLLYVIKQGNGDDNKIYTVDITDSNPTATDFMTDVTISGQLFGMVLDGNMLYYTSLGGDIYVTDITDASHAKTLIISGIQRCRGLAVKDNYLYVSCFDLSKIIKINLSDTFPTTATDVFTNLFLPRGIKFNGDDLYICDFIDGSPDQIVKIDVTETNPTATVIVAGLDVPDAIQFIGNEMYFTDNNQIDRIAKIDITESFPPTVTDVVINISGNVHGFVFDGDDIYIAEYGFGVSKFTQNTASILETNLNTVSIYPNPTSNALTITGIENAQFFSIYNIIGKEVKTGKITSNNTIDVNQLKKGVYFLKLKGKNITYTKKFIKQ